MLSFMKQAQEKKKKIFQCQLLKGGLLPDYQNQTKTALQKPHTVFPLIHILTLKILCLFARSIC